MTEAFMLWLRSLFGLSKPRYNAYYQPNRMVIQVEKRDGSGNWLVWNWNNARWDERKGPLNKYGELDDSRATETRTRNRLHGGLRDG